MVGSFAMANFKEISLFEKWNYLYTLNYFQKTSLRLFKSAKISNFSVFYCHLKLNNTGKIKVTIIVHKI